MLKRLLIVVGFLVTVAAALLAGWGAGSAWGTWCERNRKFEEEKRVIAPVLASEQSFSRIKPLMSTAEGKAFLVGELDTPEEYVRLRARIGKVLGEYLLGERMLGVSVRNEPVNSPR